MGQNGPVVIYWMTAFLDFPSTTFDRGVDYWRRITGYDLSPARGTSGEFATLVPPNGDAFLRVQRLDAGPAGCHVDLHCSDLGQVRVSALGLGAALLSERDGLAIMRSPGGFVFCLVRHRGEESRPEPATWPGGHHSLVDQICIDVPARHFVREGEFWSAFTGWALTPGSRDEFTVLNRPRDMPLRVLLQRTDDALQESARAHLDFSCDDVGAEVRRHAEAGATQVGVMPDWTTLADPAGHSYCVTRRDPTTGRLPT